MDEDVLSEVAARLEAISPAIAAQVRADASGAPTRTAANLLSSDANVISNAAKHAFGLPQPFGELTPKGARRLQRGRKKEGGRGPSDGLIAPLVQCVLVDCCAQTDSYVSDVAVHDAKVAFLEAKIEDLLESAPASCISVSSLAIQCDESENRLAALNDSTKSALQSAQAKDLAKDLVGDVVSPAGKQSRVVCFGDRAPSASEAAEAQAASATSCAKPLAKETRLKDPFSRAQTTAELKSLAQGLDEATRQFCHDRELLGQARERVQYLERTVTEGEEVCQAKMAALGVASLALKQLVRSNSGPVGHKDNIMA